MPRLRPLRLLDRFRRRTARDRGALVRATIMLLTARVALAVMPFATVLSCARRAGNPARPGAGQRSLEHMVRAVDVVGNRLFPKNPCLVQALVVQRLYLKEGRPAELRIGVRKTGSAGLVAHAWIESDGAVVIGARGLDVDLVPLPPIRPGASPVRDGIVP